MPSFFKSKNNSLTDPIPPTWVSRMRAGLSRTRDNFGRQISGLFGGGKIDEALYEELETVLLTSDVGVNATTLAARRAAQKSQTRQPYRCNRNSKEHCSKRSSPFWDPWPNPSKQKAISLLSSCWRASMARERPPPSASSRIIFSCREKPCCLRREIRFAPPHVSN